MAARNSPRTMQALASVEPNKRSDFITFCQGVDNLCAQLSLIILTFADDLYRRLASAGGRNGGYGSRAKARIATRPLRGLAAVINNSGKLANRAYRIYAKHYADEISPDRKKRQFDHNK
jgi:hypothetical protein